MIQVKVIYFIFQRHGIPYNGKILSEVGHAFGSAGRMGVTPIILNLT